MNYTKQLYHGHPSSTDHTHTQRKISPSPCFLVHFMGDVHQPLHCSRTTDRGGNNIHVHYYHSSDQNRVFIRSPQLTPVANSICRYDQSQWIPRVRIPLWIVEGANTAMNSREYRPHRRRKNSEISFDLYRDDWWSFVQRVYQRHYLHDKEWWRTKDSRRRTNAISENNTGCCMVLHLAHVDNDRIGWNMGRQRIHCI